MLLNKQLIHYNYSSRNGARIAYIVVHDTGNPDRGADAMAHYRYFSGGNRRASAHYFVDDMGVVQIIEDAYAAWHCGEDMEPTASPIAIPSAWRFASIAASTARPPWPTPAIW